MKKLICLTFLYVVLSAIAPAQNEKRFPGLVGLNAEILQAAKKVTPVALPTWLPAGFAVEKVDAKLGSMVPVEDKKLVIIYSRKTESGRMQRFAIEAGFEGLGDLPYDATSTVKSAIGQIDIAYEPPDLDGNGTKTKNFVMTHWFNVGKTAFHYDGMYGDNSENSRLAMISLADTEKILRSLQRF